MTDSADGVFNAALGDHIDTSGQEILVVTSVADTFNHSDDNSALSLREAIDLANGPTGANEVWLPGWKQILTRDRETFGTGTEDMDIAFGDLDIERSVTIRGIAGLTSVEWKYDVKEGDGKAKDKVFDLLGDYSGDGSADGDVSSADYTIWLDTLGSETDLRADGNDDGIIDQADRDVWAAHFGNVLTLTNVLVNV